MKIRQAHLDAFVAALARDHAERLARHLMRAHPEAGPRRAAEAIAFVEAEVARARSHGIEDEAAVELYVTASWLVEGPVDEYDGATLLGLLGDRTLAPHYRAVLALERVTYDRGYRDG